MSSPYIGEIRMVGFSFAPSGWARCDGQSIPIMENDSLFSVIGTMYGGDGVDYFQLPDLRGRMPMHAGTSNVWPGAFIQGDRGGSEFAVLQTNHLPAHNHTLNVAATANNNSPAQGVPAGGALKNFSRVAPSTAVFGAGTLAATGSGATHENRMPYTTVNFILSLYGIYPPRA